MNNSYTGAAKRGPKPGTTPQERRQCDLKILRMRKAGYSIAVIAAALGLTKSAVQYRLDVLRAEYEER